MKTKLLLSLCILASLTIYAQDFTGQWKGYFTDGSNSSALGNKCEYVLELECNGNTVNGSSYTYSFEGGKKYYSICSVTGFINRNQKYIEVRETERTKTNWPEIFGNCLQVHKLTYFKHSDTSTLEGKWEPGPGQGKCGFGNTVLTRRELKQSFPNYNTAASKSLASKQTVAKTIKKPGVIVPIKKDSVLKKFTAKATIPAIRPSATPVTKHPLAAQPQKNTLKKDLGIVDTSLPAIKSPLTIIEPELKFKKRSNTVLKTIQVENNSVKVDLYDNGEVDGDSISLFYNGKLLLSGKRLSEKPITLTINVEDNLINELVMYAENLGTIPPNTALMVVTDGTKRYEVRITSDLQKSGVINFVHKPRIEDNKK